MRTLSTAAFIAASLAVPRVPLSGVAGMTGARRVAVGIAAGIGR